MVYDSADNAENWVKQGPDNNGLSNYLASRYFSDTDRWFILSSKGEHQLNMFERKAPVFSVNDDFGTDNTQAKGVCRLSVGHTDWRGVYGSTGA